MVRYKKEFYDNVEKRLRGLQSLSRRYGEEIRTPPIQPVTYLYTKLAIPTLQTINDGD
jgi:hypothetical protein